MKDLAKIQEFFSKPVNEANGFKSGKEFINIKLRNYPKAIAKVNQLIAMIGEPNFTMDMAEWIWDFFNNASYESPVNEASKEEETEFHKKLDKLVHSTFGKRKDELEEAVIPSNIKEFANELYGEPVENFNEFQRVYNKKDLTERVINRLKNDPRRTKK